MNCRRRIFLLTTVALLSGPACRTAGPKGESRAASHAFVSWPKFGPVRDGLVLTGHTNELADFVGPVDGSARLTIFTEGNHFPVFLPLVFDAFPAWCRAEGACDVEADEILVVTLPQVMVVRALESGSVTLGNAMIGVAPGRVFPEIVLGGEGPLRRLARTGTVQPEARPFARHRGMGLLLRRDASNHGRSLAALARAPVSVVVATPMEAGARDQYRSTLEALVGKDGARRILKREVRTFPGRLGIQHRDVPYALLRGHAGAGLIFAHLAAFYARVFMDDLVFVPVKGAERFGRTILFARTMVTGGHALAAAFERFLFLHAQKAYPEGGFMSDGFEYGRTILLTAGPS